MKIKKLLSFVLAAVMLAPLMPVVAAGDYGTVTTDASDGSMTLNFGEDSITQSGGGSMIDDAANGVKRPDNLKTNNDGAAILTLPSADISGYTQIDLYAASKNDAQVTVRVGKVTVAEFDSINNGSWDSYRLNTAKLLTSEASGNVTLTIAGAAKTYCGNYVYVKFYGKETGSETPGGAPVYLDTSRTFEERAADLVSRMTLEEKVAQLGYQSPAIERLGVSAYNYWKEALHGVARQGQATSFPTALSMSNTWNRELINKAADIISTEARAKNSRYNLSYWSPTVNMARDPRWGRNEETMGEDPYLTGQLGAEFVKGMQGNDPTYLKTIATLKHFAANNNEQNRSGGSSLMTEFNLRNYYTKVFQNITEEVMPASFMSSYNATSVYRNGMLLYNFQPSAANKYLLTDLLRRNWGFDGYVTTDCGAGEYMARSSAFKQGMLGSDTLPIEQYIAEFYKNGLNLECNLSGGNWSTSNGAAAVKNGYLSEEELERAVYELFLQRFRTGEFDDDTVIYRGYSAVDIESAEHIAAAEEVAEESWVLLKNEDNILPLKNTVSNAAVVGNMANTLALGDYTGSPKNTVTPIAGIRKELGDIGVEVSYLGEVTDDEKLFNVKNITFVLKNGSIRSIDLSKAESVSGMSLQNGALIDVTAAASAVIRNVDFSNVAKVRMEMSVGSRIGGSLNLAYGQGGTTFASVHSMATADNDSYEVCEVVLGGDTGGYDGVNDMYLSASPTVLDFSVENFKAQLDAADVIIAYAGTIPKQDGFGNADSSESKDRVTIDLPSHQSHVQALCDVYADKTIVVMSTVGQINAEPFINKCKAILWTSYNGQTQGTALGKVLTGEVNPSGRLTTTWYVNADVQKMELYNKTSQIIDGIKGNYTDYNIQSTAENPGHTYQYYSGVPIYPFGYGMSYTEFRYSNMTIDKTTADVNDTVTVTVDVTNTGGTAGQEVVQLYVSHPQVDSNTPKKQLKEFTKVALAPNETKTVRFTLSVQDWALYDESAQKNVVLSGTYTIYAGKNANDESNKKSVTVSGMLASTIKTVKAVPDGIKVSGLIAEDGTGLQRRTKIDPRVSVVMTDEQVVENPHVTLISSNSSIAAVEDGKIVSGTKEGVAVITASVTINGETETDTFPVVNVLAARPSAERIDAAKAEITAMYQAYPQAAYSSANYAVLTQLYYDAVNAAEIAESVDALDVLVADTVAAMRTVELDALTAAYAIRSVNENILINNVIDYRDGGIPPYHGADGTITNLSPYSGIKLAAYDESGAELKGLVWQIKKLDSSARKVADIDSITGELTVYGNGIVQITAADIANLKCAKMTVHVNVQVEGEYADDGGGANLSDTQSRASGGMDVGSSRQAWIEYKGVKLNMLENVLLRYSLKSGSQTVYISLDKSTDSDKLLASAAISETGGWNNWADTETLAINQNVLKNAVVDEYGCGTIYIQTNTANLDYFKLNYIEVNDDLPYVIKKTANKQSGIMTVTLGYRGSAVLSGSRLTAEIAGKPSQSISVSGAGEYEIETGAVKGETVRLTVKSGAGNPLSETVSVVWRAPAESEVIVYSLDSTDFDYSPLTGGEENRQYADTVNGLSGYGVWTLDTGSSSKGSYTYTDINGKTYDYAFTKSWKAGRGGETGSNLFFTPKSACKITAVFSGGNGRIMHIRQGSTDITGSSVENQKTAFDMETSNTAQPVYIYGEGSNKFLHAIIVEYYGAEDESAPTVSMEYTDGVVIVNSDAARSALLIAAEYINNRLSGIPTLIPVDLQIGKTTLIRSFPDGTKLMLWDSMGSMHTLADSITVSGETAHSVAEKTGEDFAIQYIDWNGEQIMLSKNTSSGITKVWRITSGGNIELYTESFYSVPSGVENYFPQGSLTINTLAVYNNRLFAGCDNGYVIMFTDCVKCYQLKKPVDFDITEMEIIDGIMSVRGSEKSADIDMNTLGGNDIELFEAEQLIQNRLAVLIDVRDAADYALRHDKESVNIPIDILEDKLNSYDKKSTLIFCCYSGARAAQAVLKAYQMGFKSVYNLGSFSRLLD